MADKHLIYKEDLKEIVSNMVEIPTEMRVRMLGAITLAKTVDAEPVVHGRWDRTYVMGGIERKYSRFMVKCSVCGWGNVCQYNYCPNCGAKMDGGAEDGK